MRSQIFTIFMLNFDVEKFINKKRAKKRWKLRFFIVAKNNRDGKWQARGWKIILRLTKKIHFLTWKIVCWGWNMKENLKITLLSFSRPFDVLRNFPCYFRIFFRYVKNEMKMKIDIFLRQNTVNFLNFPSFPNFPRKITFFVTWNLNENFLLFYFMLTLSIDFLAIFLQFSNSFPRKIRWKFMIIGKKFHFQLTI